LLVSDTIRGALIGAGATVTAAVIAFVGASQARALHVEFGPTPMQTVTVMPSPGPTSADPTTPSPSPDSTTVRRKTDPNTPLTLTDGYRADLDSRSPNWDVAYADTDTRFDITWSTGGGGGLSANDVALVDGPARPETCIAATAYSDGVPENDLKDGATVCVRTSDHRFAYLTVRPLSPVDDSKVTLDVVVWEAQNA
jgi:hypothetical protein